MASSITAPTMPAMMEDINPPLPAPAPMPKRLRSQPPITAPTMPIMIVTIMPPGSSPGMINLASAPAMSPTMSQNNKAVIISSPFFSFVGNDLQEGMYPKTRSAYTPFHIEGG